LFSWGFERPITIAPHLFQPEFIRHNSLELDVSHLRKSFYASRVLFFAVGVMRAEIIGMS
jgi:hypothetical protein